ANEAVVAPGAVSFSSTLAVLSLKLATRRSGRPSPLTSPSATEKGARPVAKGCWGAREGEEGPGAVSVSSSLTVAVLTLATRRSGKPSPLTAPSATETGPRPVAKVCWGANEAVSDPGAVSFSSTPTVALFLLATRRSGRPSPLTSPSATEVGVVPVAN